MEQWPTHVDQLRERADELDRAQRYEEALDLRRRLALDYLESKRVSVNETAFLVGFSDRSAFSRAFKRWTGKGPAQRG